MRRLILSLFGTACALFCFTAVGKLVSAEELQAESLRIKTGEIFEILAFSSTPQMTYTWVIEQNGTFLQATRNGFFQTRLTQAGEYILNVEAVDSQGTIIRRTFPITVEERTPGDVEITPGTTLVTSEPSFDSQNRIIRQSDTDIFILAPSREDMNVLIADLNTNYDSNGDGFSDNDEDTTGTSFRTGMSRLHVWLVNPVTSQDMRITGIAQTEETVTQSLNVASRAAIDGGTGETFFPPDVSSEGSTSSMSSETIADGEFGKINASTETTGAIRFSVTLRDFTTEDPLLLHWDFGDTEQSLLSSPVHQYAIPGNYTVRLSVRDLRSGEELAVLSTELIVSGSEDSSSSNAEESSSSSSVDTTKPVENEDGSSTFGLLGKLILAFVIAGGVGGLIAFGFSRIRRGKTLEQTFAEAEKNLMGKTDASQITDLPPLQLADEPENDVIDLTPEEEPVRKTLEPSLEQLQTEPDKAPSWLKPGIERAEEMDYSVATPAPAVLQNAPQPIPPPPVYAPSPEPEEPLPDWLSAKPAPQSTPTPAPLPKPEVVKVPEPAPQIMETEVTEGPTPEPVHAPLTPKVEELQTQKEEAPSWLKAGLTQAEEEGMSATTPVPAPLAEPVAPAEIPTAPVPVVSPATPAKSAAEAEREDHLREKRREKRKRYRDNKKKRETEEKATTAVPTPVATPAAALEPVEAEPSPTTTEPASLVQPLSEPEQGAILQAGEISEDEPVAYIRADSIEEQQQNTEPDSPKSAS